MKDGRCAMEVWTEDSRIPGKTHLALSGEVRKAFVGEVILGPLCGQLTVGQRKKWDCSKGSSLWKPQRLVTTSGNEENESISEFIEPCSMLGMLRVLRSQRLRSACHHLSVLIPKAGEDQESPSCVPT